jgi:hypothetical protein
MKVCRAILAGMAPVILCGPSFGANQDEIQVYDYTINKPGEFGLEIHLNTTPAGRTFQDYPGEVTDEHGFRYTYEFSYGLTKDIELGLYIDTETDGAGTFYFEAEKYRLKWLPLQPGGNDNTGWFAGTNWEYSLGGHEFSQSRAVLELRVIAGYKAGDWLFSMNPVFDWNMSEGYRDIDPDFTASFKLTHKIVDGLFGGIEYYGDIGKLVHAAALEQQDQRLFAVIDVDMEPYVFNFGIGRGFTRQADEWTIKAIIEVPVEQISKLMTERSK